MGDYKNDWKVTYTCLEPILQNIGTFYSGDYLKKKKLKRKNPEFYREIRIIVDN